MGFVESNGGDGIFDDNHEYLYFYALGPSDWADRYDPSLPDTVFINHPYEKRNYCYLAIATDALPVGGTPKRITTLAPSYMHSWSPDAKSLVYTGGRTPGQGQPQNLDIYRIASDGSGPETEMRNYAAHLEGIKVDGRWVVVYSKYDIGCAIEGHKSADCLGYDKDSALKIASAVVLYSLRR